MSPDLHPFPEGLPAPEDDGACNHLPGLRLPPLPLLSTGGGTVDLSTLPGMTILYIYPMTGRPDVELPPHWDQIPGARGCTVQSLAYRNLHGEFQALGVRVIGLSAQSTADQTEARARLFLPYPLLSDERLHFARSLSLPTFMVEGMTLLKRHTQVIEDGAVKKVFYPVFPPQENAQEVLEWLTSHT